MTALNVRTTPTLTTFGPLGYSTVLEAGDDFARELDVRQVQTYVEHVGTVVARAELEFALLRMGRDQLKLELDSVAQLVIDLRSKAGPIPDSGVEGLRWSPLTSDTAEIPQVTVEVEGLGPGQMSAEDAAQHLLHVLMAQQTAPLDEAMLQVLTKTVGLNEPTARAVIDGLGEHRS